MFVSFKHKMLVPSARWIANFDNLYSPEDYTQNMGFAGFL